MFDILSIPGGIELPARGGEPVLVNLFVRPSVMSPTRIKCLFGAFVPVGELPDGAVGNADGEAIARFTSEFRMEMN